ncbi:MAG: hypothetical protein SFZ03_08720 [Candidatus Melainabacteria bacterium]|nr:hypothetical protein [Candidatus Melainabacteria bacterium]
MAGFQTQFQPNTFSPEARYGQNRFALRPEQIYAQPGVTQAAEGDARPGSRMAVGPFELEHDSNNGQVLLQSGVGGQTNRVSLSSSANGGLTIADGDQSIEVPAGGTIQLNNGTAVKVSEDGQTILLGDANGSQAVAFNKSALDTPGSPINLRAVDPRQITATDTAQPTNGSLARDQVGANQLALLEQVIRGLGIAGAGDTANRPTGNPAETTRARTEPVTQPAEVISPTEAAQAARTKAAEENPGLTEAELNRIEAQALVSASRTVAQRENQNPDAQATTQLETFNQERGTSFTLDNLQAADDEDTGTPVAQVVEEKEPTTETSPTAST